MSDPEAFSSRAYQRRPRDFSGLRPAADHSDYSLPELQWNGLRFAAVPALLRDGGVLLVPLEEAFTGGELTSASADSPSRLVGPFGIGTCTLRSSRRVELQSEVPALLAGLDADTFRDPESDRASALRTKQGLRGVAGIGLSKDWSLWLAADGVRRLLDLYHKLASPGNPLHSRHSPYATGESGSEGGPGLGPGARPALPTRRAGSAGGVPSSRLSALEAPGCELAASPAALLATQPGVEVEASRALKHGASLLPRSGAAAGRAGFSSEQLTALLRAAGRPPERLPYRRPAALTGASSLGHPPHAGPLRDAGFSHPPSGLLNAAPPLLPTGVLSSVKGDGGWHQLGWLLPGMPNPPFQLVRGLAQRQEVLDRFFESPRRVAANPAYFKDVDHPESRTELTGGETPTRDPAAAPQRAPQPEAKGAPQAAAKPVDSGAGEAP